MITNLLNCPQNSFSLFFRTNYIFKNFILRYVYIYTKMIKKKILDWFYLYFFVKIDFFTFFDYKKKKFYINHYDFR